ncbi:MAG: hypothetical protein M5R41_05940 [Bacteroidia bacterium]|nr:hypothetical protein [Bacteroidia bacterium]
MASIIYLREVVKTERQLYFVLTEADTELRDTPAPAKPLEHAASRVVPVPSPPQTVQQRIPETQVAEVDVFIPKPDSARVWTPPKRVLDPEITPEQAWVELTRLIGEYPQYKDMVVREMLAGSGFVRDSLPPVSFRLEDVMKFEQFVPSWVIEAARVQGSYGGYNPVLGYRRAEQYTGPQLNVIQALKFLIDLIGGE